jgi:hypothetical protein
MMISVAALPGSLPSFSPGNAFPIPGPYYSDASCPGQDLASLLQATGLMPPYRDGEFDCSEQAALLQWRLRCQGYDAKICASNHFLGKDGCHAWVAVDLQGVRYYIESTAPSLIPIGPGDRYYEKYDHPELVTDAYGIAAVYGMDQVDWWNSKNFSQEAEHLGRWY